MLRQLVNCVHVTTVKLPHIFLCHNILEVLKANFVYFQTLDMLEKKEKVLEKKAAAKLERAKEFSKAKNKRGMVNH